jgi:hypothetical protein
MLEPRNEYTRLIMRCSLLTRFFLEFSRGFGKTVKEDKFDRAVILAALLYLLVSGLFFERWEFVITIVLALCLISIYHAFVAAYSVKKETDAEIIENSREKHSGLYDPFNRPITITPKINRPFLLAVRLYSIAFMFVVASGFIGYSILQHRIEADPRPLFIREFDRPLLGIYAIATLETEMTRKDLGEFGFHVQLSDTELNPHRAGLYLSAFPATENLPTFRPPFLGPSVRGMKSIVWSSPSRPITDNFPRSVTVLSNILVMGYESLDRIETGGRVSDSPFTNMGDLNHAFIQIVVSTPLSKQIKRINFVANDYVIYSISESELLWEPVRLPDASLVLPSQMTNLGLVQAKLSMRYMTLNLDELHVKKHKIIYSGPIQNGLVATTVLPGEHGWLPSDQ